MQIRLRNRLVPGPLATVLGVFVAVLAALFVSMPAAAQVSQLVGSPLTTKRFERLLRIYVEPTSAEATALDGLHEAYLDRFRAELDPEIQQVGRSMPSGMPSKQEFEKFLREIDRIQERIAAADKALFDSAVELVAPERRAGIERIRSARERQRELSGFTRLGAQMFGGGPGFVDLPDMLARERHVELMEPETRARFDALLLEQERRSIAQARSYSSSVRKSMSKLWDAMSAFEGNIDAPDPEGGESAQAAQAAQMQRMAAMMEAMRAAGEEPRKSVQQNFEANRVAIRQFIGVLPEVEVHRLREEIARKSGGMLGMSMMFDANGNTGDVASVIRRVRRDTSIAPDVVAALAPIELTWRRERAEVAEKLADLTLSIDMTSMMMGVMDEAGGPRTEIESEMKRRAEIDERAFEAITELLGPEAAGRFVRKIQFQRATGNETRWNVVPQTTEEDDNTNDPMQGWRPGFASMFDIPAPISVADIISKLRLCNVEVPAPEVLEAVVDGWRLREWDAKVTPLWSTAMEARRNLYKNANSDDFSVDPAARSQERNALRMVADAIVAADRALCEDVAMALDLKPDGPEMALLRLERLTLVRDDGGFDGSLVDSPTPAKVIAAARVDGAVARAFLEAELPRWNALADEISALLKATIQRADDLSALSETRGDREGWERTRAVMERNAEASRAFSARLSELFRSASEKASESPQVRASIQNAFLAVLRPDVYRASDSALVQLDRAIALDGLTTEQRGRLDALRAEYEAVYTDLSAKMAKGPEASSATDDDEYGRAWAERAETLAKLRFQRNERTEKARSEARRILGDDLAKRVRGLIPDEDSNASSRRQMGFDPFETDDD